LEKVGHVVHCTPTAQKQKGNGRSVAAGSSPTQNDSGTGFSMFSVKIFYSNGLTIVFYVSFLSLFFSFYSFKEKEYIEK